LTIKIFVSYCSVDRVFKEQFIDGDYFLPSIGPVAELFDYELKVNFGEILPELNERINESSAIVMLISRHYVGSKYSLAEFWAGLEQHAQRNLVFVPVMIDAAAR
jgi:hypothetical protein